MRWRGNQKAQTEADSAWNAVKFKFDRKKKKPVQNKSQKRPGQHVSYFDYIRSKAWAKKKQVAMRHYGSRCYICKSTDNLHVHHKTYAHLGNEPMADLRLLCADCHANHHEGAVFGVCDPMTREFRNIVS